MAEKNVKVNEPENLEEQPKEGVFKKLGKKMKGFGDKTVRQVAKGTVKVLILGATGVGGFLLGKKVSDEDVSEGEETVVAENEYVEVDE